MPSGSGPQVAKVTAVNVAAAEVVVATVTASWQQPAGQQGAQGNLLTASVNFTPGTGQTLTTLRVRQGAGTTGALVGIAHPETTAAGVQADLGLVEFDTSAFAQSAAPGQYTLTAQCNAAGPGTVNQATLQLETSSPVI